MYQFLPDESSCCECESCEVQCLRLCNVCCCCCDKFNEPGKTEHPHILYGQLVQDQDSNETANQPSQSESPVGKGYKYPQKYREYVIPPQLVKDSGGVVVRQQPRASRSLSDVKTHRQGQRTTKSVSDIKDALNMIDEQYDSMEEDTDVGYVDISKRPSLVTIERSPEHTLERGKEIEFPGQRRMSIGCIRKLDLVLTEKLEELKPACTPDIPGVHFSLSYDEQKFMLIVHVSYGINLPTQRPEQTSNPYIQVYLLPTKSEVQQSHSIEGTHSPFYDRLFRFTKLSLDSLRRCAVVIRFYINVHHFIGGVLYGLEEADLMGNKIVHSISQYDEEEGLKVCLMTEFIVLPNGVDDFLICC